MKTEDVPGLPLSLFILVSCARTCPYTANRRYMPLDRENALAVCASIYEKAGIRTKKILFQRDQNVLLGTCSEMHTMRL
jgi:hypothetical protein